MLSSLFNLFNSVLTNLPTREFFIALVAAGVLFFIGSLIKYIFID